MKHDLHLTLVKRAAFMLLLFTLHPQVSTLLAQGTSFTYQGRLNDNGSPANGLYDVKFTLFDSPANGDSIGPLTNSAVAVSNGLFTVLLDFGPKVFNGHPNFFLEVAVRAAGGGDFTTLNPRQPVTPSPYAIHAGSATKLFNGAVTRLNNLTNDVTLAAGQNVTITPSGSTLTIGASGINPWQTVGTNIQYLAGNVGIGTAAPRKRLTVAGDMEIGINSGDYHHLRIGGGNSDGFLYGSFAHFGDGIHMGYNYYADAGGNNRIIHPDGGASRLSLLYGAIVLATTPAFGGEPINRVVVDAIGNVGIGTVAPLAKLDVRGDIRLGPSGQFRAASGEENLRIIRGVVAANGSIIVGAGFTVTHNSVGNYVITFNTPFAGPPSVTGTVEREPLGGQDRTIMTDGVTSANATLVTRINEAFAGFEDLPFHFIAVGPR